MSCARVPAATENLNQSTSVDDEIVSLSQVLVGLIAVLVQAPGASAALATAGTATHVRARARTASVRVVPRRRCRFIRGDLGAVASNLTIRSARILTRAVRHQFGNRTVRNAGRPAATDR
jgi:hypothetical protein